MSAVAHCLTVICPDTWHVGPKGISRLQMPHTRPSVCRLPSRYPGNPWVGHMRPQTANLAARPRPQSTLPIVPRVLSVSWVGKRVSEKRAWALGRANEPLPPVSASQPRLPSVCACRSSKPQGAEPMRMCPRSAPNASGWPSARPLQNSSDLPAGKHAANPQPYANEWNLHICPLPYKKKQDNSKTWKI